MSKKHVLMTHGNPGNPVTKDVFCRGHEELQKTEGCSGLGFVLFSSMSKGFDAADPETDLATLYRFGASNAEARGKSRRKSEPRKTQVGGCRGWWRVFVFVFGGGRGPTKDHPSIQTSSRHTNLLHKLSQIFFKI